MNVTDVDDDEKEDLAELSEDGGRDRNELFKGGTGNSTQSLEAECLCSVKGSLPGLVATSGGLSSYFTRNNFNNSVWTFLFLKHIQVIRTSRNMYLKVANNTGNLESRDHIYQRSDRSDFRDLRVWGVFFRTDKWMDKQTIVIVGLL